MSEAAGHWPLCLMPCTTWHHLELIGASRLHSLPGLSQLLDRLGFSYKWARSHIYSPDPNYWEKQQAVEDVLAQTRISQGRLVTVYMDQVTTYRHPTLAHSYEEKGNRQPLAERSYHSDTLTRIVASL